METIKPNTDETRLEEHVPAPVPMSETNTPEIEAKLRREFPAEYVFEHGHWWVQLNDFTFAVVDTSNGFELEQT